MTDIPIGSPDQVGRVDPEATIRTKWRSGPPEQVGEWTAERTIGPSGESGPRRGPPDQGEGVEHRDQVGRVDPGIDHRTKWRSGPRNVSSAQMRRVDPSVLDRARLTGGSGQTEIRDPGGTGPQRPSDLPGCTRGGARRPPSPRPATRGPPHTGRTGRAPGCGRGQGGRSQGRGARLQWPWRARRAGSGSTGATTGPEPRAAPETAEAARALTLHPPARPF